MGTYFYDGHDGLLLSVTDVGRYPGAVDLIYYLDLWSTLIIVYTVAMRVWYSEISKDIRMSGDLGI